VAVAPLPMLAAFAPEDRPFRAAYADAVARSGLGRLRNPAEHLREVLRELPAPRQTADGLGRELFAPATTTKQQKLHRTPISGAAAV